MNLLICHIFLLSDSENAILIRLSLKAAMGENAVSISVIFRFYYSSHYTLTFAPLKWTDTAPLGILIINSLFFSIPGTLTRCTCSEPTSRTRWTNTTHSTTRPPPSRQFWPPHKSQRFIFPVSDCWCDDCPLWVHSCRAENVLAYKETPRISFYILVIDPKTPSKYIPKSVVEEAIRLALCLSKSKRKMRSLQF